MGSSEFHDEYSESLDTEFRKLEGALLSDTVKLLAPSEPILLVLTRAPRGTTHCRSPRGEARVAESL